MPEKEDFELPKPEKPGMDIPELKKKDKEKKKSGFAWGGAKGAGSPLPGMAQPAAGAARAAASAGAGAAAGSSGGGFIAGLVATTAGKVAVTAVAVFMLGGTAAVIYRMQSASLAPAMSVGAGAGVGGQAQISAPSVTVKVRKVRPEESTALNYAAKAAQGEIAWENPQAPQAQSKAEEKMAPDQMAKQEGVQSTQEEKERKDQLEHNLSGSKLSSNLASSFGGRDIFAGKNPTFGNQGGVLNKFGAAPSAKGAKATLTKMNLNKSATMALKRAQTKDSKTLARLRGMQDYNAVMYGGKTPETKKEPASTQWDTHDEKGGTPPAAETDKKLDPNKIGGGGGENAFDCSTCDAGTYCNQAAKTCVPLQQGGNVTPWQDDVDTATGLHGKIPMILIGGLIAMLVAVYMTAWDWCSGYAATIIICGIVALMGIYALREAIRMIVLGEHINAKGGKPNGDVFEKSGWVYLASAVSLITAAIACIALQFEEVGSAAADITVVPLRVGEIIAGLTILVGSFLK